MLENRVTIKYTVNGNEKEIIRKNKDILNDVIQYNKIFNEWTSKMESYEKKWVNVNEALSSRLNEKIEGKKNTFYILLTANLNDRSTTTELNERSTHFKPESTLATLNFLEKIAKGINTREGKVDTPRFFLTNEWDEDSLSDTTLIEEKKYRDEFINSHIYIPIDAYSNYCDKINISEDNILLSSPMFETITTNDKNTDNFLKKNYTFLNMEYIIGDNSQRLNSCPPYDTYFRGKFLKEDCMLYTELEKYNMVGGGKRRKRTRKQKMKKGGTRKRKQKNKQKENKKEQEKQNNKKYTRKIINL